MAERLREASIADLSRIARPLLASGHFVDIAGLEEYVRRGAWRVQVSDADEIALVERWREHLPHLAVLGLWCEASRVPDLVAALGPLSRRKGLGSVLSPLVGPAEARSYERAGMVPCRHVRQMRRRSSGIPEPDPRWQVECGGPERLQDALSIESESFDDFWRLDEPHLADDLAVRRTTFVCDPQGVALAYALSSLHGDVGSLGRLAVRPGASGKGIGRALVREAVADLQRRGAREVVLNTQAENVAATRLYRSEGFRETPERLVMLLSAKL